MQSFYPNKIAELLLYGKILFFLLNMRRCIVWYLVYSNNQCEASHSLYLVASYELRLDNLNTPLSLTKWWVTRKNNVSNEAMSRREEWTRKHGLRWRSLLGIWSQFHECHHGTVVEWTVLATQHWRYRHVLLLSKTDDTETSFRCIQQNYVSMACSWNHGNFTCWNLTYQITSLDR